MTFVLQKILLDIHVPLDMAQVSVMLRIDHIVVAVRRVGVSGFKDVSGGNGIIQSRGN
jgi:hypothetical protein